MGLQWADGTPVHASSLLRYPSSPNLKAQRMGGEGLPEAKSPKRGDARPARSPPLTMKSEVERTRAGPPPAAPGLGGKKRYQNAKPVRICVNHLHVLPHVRLHQ